MRKILQKAVVRRARRRLRQWAGRDLKFQVERKIPNVVLGSEYGGWAVCPGFLNPISTIYSFGIGRDLSFDLALIEKSKVQVHAFDPTPLALDWLKTQELPGDLHIHEWGIADFDGTAHFDMPQNEGFVSCSMSETGQYEGQVYTLSTIMNKLGHNSVDVLKMDIEGAEYPVIKQIIESDCKIGQLLIEFHYDNGAMKQMEMAINAIELIKSRGYQIFWISDVGKEFAFIHESLSGN